MNSPRLEELGEIESAVWAELAAAAHRPGHEWRLAVLATTDGDAADARTMRLRECDAAGRTLLYYTDPRSPKAQRLAAHPLGTLVMWSGALSWQLRLRVRLELQTEGLAVSSRWARLKMTPAAQDYLSPLAPGTPLTGALPDRASREYFGVLTAEVTVLDWLELRLPKHRRAVFDSAGARWLAP